MSEGAESYKQIQSKQTEKTTCMELIVCLESKRR